MAEAPAERRLSFDRARRPRAQHIGATHRRNTLPAASRSANPGLAALRDDRPARADRATSARQAIPRWRLAYCRLLEVVSASTAAVESAATKAPTKEMLPANSEP